MVIIQNLPKEVQDKITFYTIEPSKTAKIFKENVIIKNVKANGLNYKMMCLRNPNNEIIKFLTSDEHSEDPYRMLEFEKVIIMHKVMRTFMQLKEDNIKPKKWLPLRRIFREHKMRYNIDMSD